MSRWHEVLRLSEQRSVVAGGPQQLCAAIGAGADLRIATEFRHNEHIDPGSTSAELIREVAEFRVTYLIEECWAAGIMNLRQPVSLPDGFGPRSALSLFLYNQDGSQGLARTFLDGLAPGHTDMPSDYPAVPRLHLANSYDDASNAPSQNFVYDFDVYRYFVNREWQQVLATDAGGAPRSGSLAALADAFAAGAEVKVGVDDLCADMEPLAVHRR